MFDQESYHLNKILICAGNKPLVHIQNTVRLGKCQYFYTSKSFSQSTIHKMWIICCFFKNPSLKLLTQIVAQILSLKLKCKETTTSVTCHVSHATSHVSCVMFHMPLLLCHVSSVTYHQRQQPQTLLLLTPPLCKEGWITKIGPKNPN